MSKDERHSNGHIVDDKDFTNIIGLLRILSRQLELSIQEGNTEYQIITEFCLEASAAEGVNAKKFEQHKSLAVQALQYYDRSSQRITHVSETLNLLASRLLEEEWKALDMDLNVEVKKTDSFYNAVQTKHFSDLAFGHCTLDNDQVRQLIQTRNDPNDDDIEIF